MRLILFSFFLSFVFSSCRDNIPEFIDSEEGASLSIYSVPLGASIFINSKYSGEETPAFIANLESGNNTVLLKMEGFADTTFSVRLNESQTKYVSVILLKEK